MKNFLTSRARSFRYAFEGWWHVIRTQKNAWIHAVISMAVILVCLWLHLPPRDWAVIILAIALVWSAEFFNTALEVIIDLISPKRNQLAKISKDVGAAAVLIAAAAAIIIGLLIMGPPLWEWIRESMN
ncbi:MAG: diacylglycerol kinase family protein [Chloroflexi bacterium]|nr:diacylglycerol kinase family protein [Chloroflexota bacterium]MBU1662135.1 diacylglycerol kinase family protein [Chloroflexota bacterium]